MSQANFRFATDIIRRLGEELNPSPDQSILELVKNAFDADARSCIVEFKDTDQPGGAVRVVDDGDGMDEADIINGWLVLGVSGKSARERTPLGRIPAGNKGLGRLAALRLGRRVTLSTRPSTDPNVQYEVNIDWEEFDRPGLVDQVPLSIEGKFPLHDAPGTEIAIDELKSKITRTDIKKLSRSLLLLADPFADDPSGFQPSLRSSEFADLEALVKNRYFSDAEYHLVATIDSEGRASARVLDWQGQGLFAAEHSELVAIGEPDTFTCPAVTFDLWAFILDAKSFSTRHSVALAEVRDWLQTFGGVHIYQNGLRVSPYGNSGNDWLDMNLSRVRSPEERPGTNTSIGRIKVIDTEDRLLQKTDRSGFIENETFLEIKRFASNALGWMARRRLETANKRRRAELSETPRNSEKAKKDVEDAIRQLPPKSKSVVQSAFKKYDRARTREVRALRDEVQLYRTLSTAGITASTFAHESAGNPIKAMSYAIGAVERRGRQLLKDKYETTLKKPVDLIKQSIGGLRVLSTVTLSLLDHEKRRPESVNLHEQIEAVVKMFKPFMDDRGIIVEYRLCLGVPRVFSSKAAVESVIANLLNNSITWLGEKPVETRKIQIRTQLVDSTFSLAILDSGPGITGIGTNDIWLPGQSTRANGTGLGLAIVRDTILDLGGKVTAIEHGELGGAEIIIQLPILGD